MGIRAVLLMQGRGAGDRTLHPSRGTERAHQVKAVCRWGQGGCRMRRSLQSASVQQQGAWRLCGAGPV